MQLLPLSCISIVNATLEYGGMAKIEKNRFVVEVNQQTCLNWGPKHKTSPMQEHNKTDNIDHEKQPFTNRHNFIEKSRLNSCIVHGPKSHFQIRSFFILSHNSQRSQYHHILMLNKK